MRGPNHTLPIPLLTDELEQCPAEAVSASTEIGAEPENLSGLPLEPLLTRHWWLGPLLVAVVCFVWLCADGHLASLP